MLHILKCVKCGSYGLEEKCSCGGLRGKPKPPKYSPEDKYGSYRRQHNEQKESGEGGDKDADDDDSEDEDASKASESEEE